MKRFLAVAVALCGLLCLGRTVGGAADLTVDDARAQPAGINVEAVNLTGGVVRGRIANSSTAEVRDVHLLIRYVWMWKNERNPGDDNPGRSEYDVVEGPIAPGTSMTFEHTPSPPLPLHRTDGRFQVDVTVVGLTQVQR